MMDDVVSFVQVGYVGDGIGLGKINRSLFRINNCVEVPQNADGVG